MKQSSLDIYEIRALGAITRMLGTRLTEPGGFTSGTVSCMRGYVDAMQKILKEMEEKPGADADPLGDIDRLDKWFVTGFENLVKYLEERVKDGPEMSDRHKAELYLSLQRAFVCVPIHPSEPAAPVEEADESGSA